MRLRRALAAVAVTAAALTSACGPESETAAGAPDGKGGGGGGGSTQTPSPDSSSPADVTRVYTVPQPGPRKGPVTVADVLVTSEDTIPEGVVAEIEGLAGVEAVATISVINVPIENKGYTLAAVDPAEYRTFVEAASADFADQWRRVANGEVAVALDLKDKLPTDGRGYVDLPGLEGGAQKAHVGAFAQQVTQIDMVVNDAWGEALGVKPDNALLVNTGGVSPSTLRAAITRAVGGSASVQNLDAVARFGLDPDAVQSALLVGSFADAVGVFNYTSIGGGRIAPDPAWVSSHIVTEPVPILGTVTCNRLPDAAAARRADWRCRRRGWLPRSTPTSTPAATTRASSRAAPSSPTTPTASPSTSTCPATSAAPSARWTAPSSRSSRSGASPGAATGTTPTPCTSSSTASSSPTDPPETFGRVSVVGRQFRAGRCGRRRWSRATGSGCGRPRRSRGRRAA